MSSSTEYRYNRLTWAEMNDAIARAAGRHPADRLDRAARPAPAARRRSLPVRVGLPGGRAARRRQASSSCRRSPTGSTCTTSTSPARSTSSRRSSSPSASTSPRASPTTASRRSCIVNGHGSNAPLIDLIARRTTLRDRLALRRLPLHQPGRGAVPRDQGDRRSSPTPTSSRPRSTSTSRRSGCRWTRPAPATT